MAGKRFINVRAWLVDGLLRRLFRDAGIVLSGNVAASLLALVSMGLTARALGPELLGILVLIKSYVALIEKLTAFQSWQAFIAHGARLLEQKQHSDFKSLVKFSMLLDASAAAAGALLGMAAAYVFGQWRGWDAQQIQMAVWYSAALFSSLVGTPRAVLRLFGRFNQLAIQEVAGAGIKLAGVIAACLLHGSLRAFVAVWIVTQVLDNLLLLGMVWRELRRQGFGGVLASPVRGITTRCPGLWGFVWTTNLNATVKGFSQEADTLLIGGLLGVAEAGLYKVAKQCTHVVLQLADPLYRVLFPEISKLWAKQDAASIQRLLRRLGLLSGCIIACALVGVIVLGRQLLSLAFGAPFAQAHAVLIWQMVGTMVLASTFPLASALPATGQYRAALRIMLAGVVLYLPALAVLTRAAGLAGAGAAFALHQLFRSLLLIRQMRWVLAGTPLAARVADVRRRPEPIRPAGKRIAPTAPAAHASNEVNGNSRWVEAYLHYGYRPWGGVPLPAALTIDKTARRAELARLSAPELIEEGVGILRNALSCRTVADHVVPLSGGHDSRGVLAGLLETVGPSRVRAVTYGTPGTLDFEVGRSVAKAAGVRWEGIDLRTVRWETNQLVALAASYEQPLSVFVTYPHAEMRRCLRSDSVVWSGSVGVSVGGSWYCFQEPSATWAQARSRFALGEGRLSKRLPLTPPGFNPASALPDEPRHDERFLLYDDQLNLFIRHACSFIPTLHIAGHDVRVPYLDPAWAMFVLCIPHRYRYEKLYERVLATAFPAFFALPTKKNRGLPMSAAPWRVKLRRLAIRAWKMPRRLMPVWPWGADPVLKSIDFDRALRTNAALRAVVDENISDLVRRRLVDWLDVERIWRLHRLGRANHTEAILLLTSLELALKAKESPEVAHAI